MINCRTKKKKRSSSSGSTPVKKKKKNSYRSDYEKLKKNLLIEQRLSVSSSSLEPFLQGEEKPLIFFKKKPKSCVIFAPKKRSSFNPTKSGIRGLVRDVETEIKLLEDKTASQNIEIHSLERKVDYLLIELNNVKLERLRERNNYESKIKTLESLTMSLETSANVLERKYLNVIKNLNRTKLQMEEKCEMIQLDGVKKEEEQRMVVSRLNEVNRKLNIKVLKLQENNKSLIERKEKLLFQKEEQIQELELISEKKDRKITELISKKMIESNEKSRKLSREQQILESKLMEMAKLKIEVQAAEKSVDLKCCNLQKMDDGLKTREKELLERGKEIEENSQQVKRERKALMEEKKTGTDGSKEKDALITLLKTKISELQSQNTQISKDNSKIGSELEKQVQETFDLTQEVNFLKEKQIQSQKQMDEKEVLQFSLKDNLRLIKDLKNKVNESNKGIRMLKNQKVVLKESDNELKEKIVEGNIKSFRTMVELSNSIISSAKNQEAASQEIRKMQKSKEELVGVNSKMTKQISSLKERVKKFEETETGIRNNMKKVENEHCKTVQRNQSLSEELLREKDEKALVDRHVKALSSKVSSLEENLNDSREREEKSSLEITEWIGKCNGLSKLVDAGVRDKEKMENDFLEQLEKTSYSLQLKEADFKNQSDQLSRLDSELKDMQRKNKKVVAARNTSMKDISLVKKELSNKRGVIESMRKELSLANKELCNKKGVIESLKEELSEQKQSGSQMNSTIQKYDVENGHFKRELQEAKRLYTDLTKMHSSLKVTHTNLGKTHRSLKETLDLTRKEVLSLRKKNDEYSSQVISLEQKLRELAIHFEERKKKFEMRLQVSQFDHEKHSREKIFDLEKKNMKTQNSLKRTLEKHKNDVEELNTVLEMLQKELQAAQRIKEKLNFLLEKDLCQERDVSVLNIALEKGRKEKRTQSFENDVLVKSLLLRNSMRETVLEKEKESLEKKLISREAVLGSEKEFLERKLVLERVNHMEELRLNREEISLLQGTCQELDISLTEVLETSKKKNEELTQEIIKIFDEKEFLGELLEKQRSSRFLAEKKNELKKLEISRLTEDVHRLLVKLRKEKRESTIKVDELVTITKKQEVEFVLLSKDYEMEERKVAEYAEFKESAEKRICSLNNENNILVDEKDVICSENSKMCCVLINLRKQNEELSVELQKAANERMIQLTEKEDQIDYLSTRINKKDAELTKLKEFLGISADRIQRNKEKLKELEDSVIVGKKDFSKMKEKHIVQIQKLQTKGTDLLEKFSEEKKSLENIIAEKITEIAHLKNDVSEKLQCLKKSEVEKCELKEIIDQKNIELTNISRSLVVEKEQMENERKKTELSKEQSLHELTKVTNDLEETIAEHNKKISNLTSSFKLEKVAMEKRESEKLSEFKKALEASISQKNVEVSAISNEFELEKQRNSRKHSEKLKELQQSISQRNFEIFELKAQFQQMKELAEKDKEISNSLKDEGETRNQKMKEMKKEIEELGGNLKKKSQHLEESSQRMEELKKEKEEIEESLEKNSQILKESTSAMEELKKEKEEFEHNLKLKESQHLKELTLKGNEIVQLTSSLKIERETNSQMKVDLKSEKEEFEQSMKKKESQYIKELALKTNEIAKITNSLEFEKEKSLEIVEDLNRKLVVLEESLGTKENELSAMTEKNKENANCLIVERETVKKKLKKEKEDLELCLKNLESQHLKEVTLKENEIVELRNSIKMDQQKFSQMKEDKEELERGFRKKEYIHLKELTFKRNEIVRLTNSLEIERKTSSQVREELKNERGSRAKKNNELSSLLKSSEMEKEKYGKQIQQLRNEKTEDQNEFEEKMFGLTCMLQQKEETISSLESTLNEKEVSLKKICSENETKLQSKGKKHQEIEKELEECQEKLSGLNYLLEQKEETISSLETTLNEKEVGFKKAFAECETKLQVEGKKQEQIEKECQEEISGFKIQLEQKRGIIASMETTLKKKEGSFKKFFRECNEKSLSFQKRKDCEIYSLKKMMKLQEQITMKVKCQKEKMGKRLDILLKDKEQYMRQKRNFEEMIRERRYNRKKDFEKSKSNKRRYKKALEQTEEAKSLLKDITRVRNEEKQRMKNVVEKMRNDKKKLLEENLNLKRKNNELSIPSKSPQIPNNSKEKVDLKQKLKERVKGILKLKNEENQRKDVEIAKLKRILLHEKSQGRERVIQKLLNKCKEYEELIEKSKNQDNSKKEEKMSTYEREIKEKKETIEKLTKKFQTEVGDLRNRLKEYENKIDVVKEKAERVESDEIPASSGFRNDISRLRSSMEKLNSLETITNGDYIENAREGTTSKPPITNKEKPIESSSGFDAQKHFLGIEQRISKLEGYWYSDKKKLKVLTDNRKKELQKLDNIRKMVTDHHETFLKEEWKKVVGGNDQGCEMFDVEAIKKKVKDEMKTIEIIERENLSSSNLELLEKVDKDIENEENERFNSFDTSVNGEDTFVESSESSSISSADTLNELLDLSTLTENGSDSPIIISDILNELELFDENNEKK